MTSEEPIVKEYSGITEVSLPRAPENVSQPSIEELKQFRKRSEELERQAADLQQKEQGVDEFVVSSGSARIVVEPLYTFEAQKKGLLGRDSLPADRGTLYVFQMDDPGRLFGTQGMKFPIDLIWANNDRQIVHIHKNVPPDFSNSLKSVWPARYVMEVNAGTVDRGGIRVGDVLELGKIPH